MRFLILSLLSLSTFTFISSSRIYIQPRVDTNDFLVQVLLNISETRVPNYLVNIIYDRPLEKGVSSQHVFDLFQLNSLSVNTTLEILRLLNISSSTVFSLNGLNHTLTTLRWSFTSFYNSLTTNLGLSGTPLRDALVALQIDVANFSSGITWGDPDPWSEFIKGNFTQETIQQASTAAGITVEALFGGVRDLIAAELVNWEIQNLIQLSLNHSIGKPEAVIIWNGLNITLENVYSVELFRNILGNFSERLSNHTSLGILASPNNVYINRRTYEIFESERELLDIRVETLLTKRVLTVSNINDTLYQNIVVLRHNELPLNSTNLTTIQIGYINRNLSNCNYVTLHNNTAHSVTVDVAIFVNQTFLVPRYIVADVVLGSALVCNNTVYGLAGEAVNDSIVLNVFEVPTPQPTPPPVSSAYTQKFGYQHIFVSIVVYAFIQVFRY